MTINSVGFGTENAIFNARNVHASSAEMVQQRNRAMPANIRQIVWLNVSEWYSRWKWPLSYHHRTAHWTPTESLPTSPAIKEIKLMRTRNTQIMIFFIFLLLFLFQEIAALLISFDKHSEWQSKEVRTRWVKCHPFIHLMLEQLKTAPGTHKFDWFDLIAIEHRVSMCLFGCFIGNDFHIFTTSITHHSVVDTPLLPVDLLHYFCHSLHLRSPHTHNP